MVSEKSPLGKRTESRDRYAPDLLFGIPRREGRQALGIADELPFSGVDVWNAYELSWLNESGKPVVAMAELLVPATSPGIVESKSLKLYLNSLSGMRYPSLDAVKSLIVEDLGRVVGGEVAVRLTLPSEAASVGIAAHSGVCIDDQDLEIQTYTVDPQLLAGSAEAGTDVEETLHSNLLKNNCPVTAQPDWATVSVRYQGARIDRAALLRYIVSYRNHAEFHEQCVERIFIDLKRHCSPRGLTVYARYTRRGGLDINPFRSDFESAPENLRLWRQ